MLSSTMEKQPVKIRAIDKITRDVLQIRTEKPQGLTFQPGQATEIFVNKQGWENEGRPFTFTSLPGDDYLEFTIKTYPERKGVTNELLNLKPNDELIVNDIFGAIHYKGEGVFIAGGAGVTPFISILRDLDGKKQTGNNKLIFANKTRKDIIHQREFEKMLGANFINILSDEKADGYAHGFISEDFLKPHFNGGSTIVYVCGPPPMMDAVLPQLANLHIPETSVVMEEF